MFKAGNYWLPDTEDHIVEEYRAGGWQLDHLFSALAHVKNFEVAIDGGAHVGSWTKALAERFAHVHSYDLNPENFECLERNIQEWGLTNVTYNNIGLGDKPAKVGMVPDEKYGMKNTGGMHVKGKGNLPVDTLDNLLPDLDALDFVKLDIEGYEERALRGAATLIEKFSPVIQIEHKTRINSRYGGNSMGDLNYLVSIGYRMVGKFGSDWVFIRD